MVCTVCEGMAVRTRTKLAWAIPVDIQLLGPHLEAYVQIRPVLHQIRLCHRFGRGANAHLHKLPQELLEMVVDNLLQSNRDEFAAYSEWSEPFRCYQRLCEPIDHFDEEEFQEAREQALVELFEEDVLD